MRGKFRLHTWPSIILKMRGNLAATDFCICGVDFSNFCRRKRFNFQPKIRWSRAFGVALQLAHPTNLHFETALVLSHRALALKMRENILKAEIPRWRHRILKFSACKKRQFFAQTLKNRVESAMCTSANRIETFLCRALLLKMRANLSASDFLYLRRCFFKLSVSKTLQFPAQNSLTARFRCCASLNFRFWHCARLVSSCAGWKTARKYFENRISAFAASKF